MGVFPGFGWGGEDCCCFVMGLLLCWRLVLPDSSSVVERTRELQPGSLLCKASRASSVTSAGWLWGMLTFLSHRLRHKACSSVLDSCLNSAKILAHLRPANWGLECGACSSISIVVEVLGLLGDSSSSSCSLELKRVIHLCNFRHTVCMTKEWFL